MAGPEDRYARMALQALLCAEGAQIAIDGVFGPRSQAAFEQFATPTIRTVKDEYRIPDADVTPQPATDRVFVSQAELDRGIAAAARRFPGTEAFLRLMLTLENYPAPGGVYTSYTGKFKGVAQFSEATWNLGRRQLPEVGSYENVRGVATSLLLAAWYATDHKAAYGRLKSARVVSGNYSPEIAYLYHQQGSSAAEAYLRTGRVVYPKQSSKSIAVLQAARDIAKGTMTA